MLRKIHLLMRKNGLVTIQTAGAIMVGGLAIAAMTVYMKRALNANMAKAVKWGDNAFQPNGEKSEQFEPKYVADVMDITENSNDELDIAKDKFTYTKSGLTQSTGSKKILAP